MTRTRSSIRSKASTAATAGVDRSTTNASPTATWSLSWSSTKRLVEAETALAAAEPTRSANAAEAIGASSLAVNVDASGDYNVPACQYRHGLVVQVVARIRDGYAYGDIDGGEIEDPAVRHEYRLTRSRRKWTIGARRTAGKAVLRANVDSRSEETESTQQCPPFDG